MEDIVLLTKINRILHFEYVVSTLLSLNTGTYRPPPFMVYIRLVPQPPPTVSVSFLHLLASTFPLLEPEVAFILL